MTFNLVLKVDGVMVGCCESMTEAGAEDAGRVMRESMAVTWVYDAEARSWTHGVQVMTIEEEE